jgi:hypothetical protein
MTSPHYRDAKRVDVMRLPVTIQYPVTFGQHAVAVYCVSRKRRLTDSLYCRKATLKLTVSTPRVFCDGLTESDGDACRCLASLLPSQ